MDTLATPRLLLRRWRDEDRAPFAALNADPEVMRYFPSRLDRAASDAMIDRIDAAFDSHRYGLWAVEAGGDFIGFVGLQDVGFTAAFTPAVEIGWRLARPAWGHGYATEAARAAMAHGFGPAGLTEIVSFTAVTNARSRAVMRRLGMTHRSDDDFDHPRLAAGHPLQRQVLYRAAPGQSTVDG